MQHELMNVKEAANYLRLNYMTVYKLAQKGRIPAFKVGGNWRFKKEILDDWLTRKSIAGMASVLIVDDDATVRDILKEMIRKEGYSVTTADSGDAALRETERQRFDLIFLDLVLPDISGTQVLKTIKETTKDTIVVIVTGYADDPIALNAMTQGPLLLVRKPFRERDIIEVLNMVTKGMASNIGKS